MTKVAGACSRRINIQHRLGHQVLDEIKTVKVIRMWTHYDHPDEAETIVPPWAQTTDRQ